MKTNVIVLAVLAALATCVRAQACAYVAFDLGIIERADIVFEGELVTLDRVSTFEALLSFDVTEVLRGPEMDQVQMEWRDLAGVGSRWSGPSHLIVAGVELEASTDGPKFRVLQQRCSMPFMLMNSPENILRVTPYLD